jgi:hypothetical protein
LIKAAFQRPFSFAAFKVARRGNAKRTHLEQQKNSPHEGGLEGDLLEEGGSENAGHRESHDYRL